SAAGRIGHFCAWVPLLTPSPPLHQWMFDFSVSWVLTLPWESKDHPISGVFLPLVLRLRARSPRASTISTFCRPSPPLLPSPTCVPSSGETLLGQSAPETRGCCRRRPLHPFRPTEHCGPRHTRPPARHCGPRPGAVLRRCRCRVECALLPARPLHRGHGVGTGHARSRHSRPRGG